MVSVHYNCALNMKLWLLWNHFRCFLNVCERSGGTVIVMPVAITLLKYYYHEKM